MIRNLIVIFITTLSFSAIGQTISLDLKQNKPTTWVTILNNNTAELKYQIIDCNDPENGLYAEYAFLTASNKTQEAIDISWELHMYYNDECISCNGDSEHQRKITLQPNESIEANCLVNSNSSLKIFSKWTQINNKRVLTKIEFANISITQTH
jgi:hypothetical protein